MNLKYFDLSEFDSPDLEGSGINMDSLHLRKMDLARENAMKYYKDVKFVVNSGYRTEKHNKKVGGKSNSSHLKGLASDIRVSNSQERYAILNGLLEAGFNRIGIGRTFIHADNDPDKTPFVIWHYY